MTLVTDKIEVGYLTIPYGFVQITITEQAVTGIHFVDAIIKTEADSALMLNVKQQLKAYFNGQLTCFDLPLNSQGTEFQKKVWQALMTIPYGQVVSYQTIAEQIGAPKAVRAVGAANGKNPISIIVPCHRVIAKDGKLTGYSGGLNRKKWLLGIEGYAC